MSYIKDNLQHSQIQVLHIFTKFVASHLGWADLSKDFVSGSSQFVCNGPPNIQVYHSWAIFFRPSDTLKSIPVAALTASKEVSGSE